MRKNWIAGLAALTLVACEGGAGPQDAIVAIRITDAPPANIASAVVHISQVYLVPGDAGGGKVVVADTAAEYDLLNLQGGVSALLGSAVIPAGSYEQLRLIVESATITLKDGFTFADGSNTETLKVPSGPQTGIKVEFGGPIAVHPGEQVLVVDFDVSRSFVFQGPPDAPRSAHFQPVLHGTVMDIAGSIAGTSSPASAKGKLFAIVDLGGGLMDTVATTLADETTGDYKLWFLPPRTYIVADSALGFKTATQMVTVDTAEHVTGINFTLTP